MNVLDPLYVDLGRVMAERQTQRRLTTDSELRHTIYCCVLGSLAAEARELLQPALWGWRFGEIGGLLILSYERTDALITRHPQHLQAFLQAVHAYTGIRQVVIGGSTDRPLAYYWCGQCWHRESLERRLP